MKAEYRDIKQLVDRAGTIAVISHLRPDGDALGSLLSLSMSLQAAGKVIVPVLVDGVPERFAFLPGAALVRQSLPAAWDLMICVDCADFERTGLELSSLSRTPAVNLDHHPTNTHFGSVNVVVPIAAAAVEIVYDLVKSLDLPLGESVCANLMTGLLADTIGFRTSNVHPGSLRMAAELLEQGTDLSGLYDRVLNQRTFAAAKYWGFGLEKVQHQDQLVWSSLSLADMQESGYSENDDADLINFMSTIEGTRVTILFIEQPDGMVKISWRARNGINVADLALQFGGGGHKPAAGAMLKGTLEDVQQQVLAATRAYMNAIRN